MSSLSRPYKLLIIFIIIFSTFYTVIFEPLCVVDDNKLVFFDAVDVSFHDTLNIIFSNGGYYRPFLFLTFIFDNYVWMLFESFMHLENMLLHLGNALLLYCVTERLVAFRAGVEQPTSPLPLATALLFGLHPLTTESVNWISGRTDPLASIFLLTSFLLLLKWIHSQKTYHILFAQLAYLMACLSKETSVFYYPVGLLVLIILTLERPDEKSIGITKCNRAMESSKLDASNMLHTEIKFPQNIFLNNLGFSSVVSLRYVSDIFCCIKRYSTAYFAATITTVAYFALRKYAAYTPGSKDKGMLKLTSYLTSEKVDSSWWDKILEVFKTIGFYAKKLFIPWPLNFTIYKVSDWYALLGILVLILLAYICWKRRDLIAVLFIATFLVASSALLVSVGKLAWTLYAERYLYIPLIFFCPAFVIWLSEKLDQRGLQQHLRPIMLVICGAFLITTVQRNLIWMDGFALYEDCYRKSPGFHRAAANYAAALQQEGRVNEAKALRLTLPKKIIHRGLTSK